MRASPSREQWLAWALLGSAMVAAVVLLFWLQRGLAYADDSFNWLTLTGLGSDKVLIEPYGGHLILIPMLIYKAGLEIFGTSYTGFGVIQVALLLVLSGLVYEYGRRRVGPLLALPGAVIVLFLGSSWNVLLQPMLGIQFLCGIVPGLAALLALEREDRKGDIAACALLVLATWSFEVSLAFLAGAAVSVALRDDRWRRAWVVAIPALAYLIWRAWASQYDGSGLELSNALWIPAYIVDSLGIAGAAIFGRWTWIGSSQLTHLELYGFDLDRLGAGLFLLAAEVLGAFLIVRAVRRRGPIPATFWVAVTVMLTLWATQAMALSPDRTPGEIRYLFQGSVVVLLFAYEVARGMRMTRAALIGALALTLVAVAGNAARFKEGRDLLAAYSPTANAAIAVVNLGGGNVSPEFNPAVNAPGAFVRTGGPIMGAETVQELSRRFGSPGFSVAELLAQSEEVRTSADRVAATALGLELAPSTRTAPCRRYEATPTGFALPPGGVVLIAKRHSPLRLRRFADEYVVGLGRLSPRRPAALRIPTDAATTPWRATAPQAGSIEVCRS